MTNVLRHLSSKMSVERADMASTDNQSFPVRTWGIGWECNYQNLRVTWFHVRTRSFSGVEFLMNFKTCQGLFAIIGHACVKETSETSLFVNVQVCAANDVSPLSALYKKTIHAMDLKEETKVALSLYWAIYVHVLVQLDFCSSYQL